MVDDAVSRFADLAAVASQARTVMARVDGIIEQVRTGQWDERLDTESADALRRRIRAMSEVVRLTRATVDGFQGDEYPRWPSDPERALPINRKERFWTGTVLPGLITTPYFLNLDLFLEACGLSEVMVGGGSGPIEFYTEYNLIESIFTAYDRDRFPGAPPGGDTPDLVIVGQDESGGGRWMLAVEAKMFHVASVTALSRQLDRQQAVLSYVRDAFQIPLDRIRHVLLVPDGLPTGRLPRVTWENVLAAYDGVAPAYWTSLLRRALDQYTELRSVTASGAPNAQGRMTGSQIVEHHADGTSTVGYVGRRGGALGSELASDIATGDWRGTSYQVRADPIPGNPNWMTVAQFINLTLAVDGGGSNAPSQPE